MEAVIFMGIQASGKTTFYQELFFDTHVRINLDMLKTRHREKVLLEACLDARQSFVIDNTNPARKDRLRYIEAARQYGFEVIGYYFQSEIQACMKRNENRFGKKKIPAGGVLMTYHKLELPAYKEGYDRLYYVKIEADTSFTTEDWNDEI
ncbi:MAG: AAA family ATPase [Sedimentisphaerales bacterium]|nr:AAA family ATPase [Sedimentisphaerales bacterium]